MNIVNFIFLIGFSVLCIIYLIQSRKASAPITFSENDTLNDKVYNILLFVVIAIAVSVRVYDFGNAPGVVWCDEAMAAVDAKALAEYGTDRFGMPYPVHLTAWGYGQMSSLLSYLMTPFIKIFGFSTVVIRLPALIVSFGGLICLYLFVKNAFNRNLALVVLAFAAINPWHFIQSRWALDCNLYAHFFMIGVYFLYGGIQKKYKLFISMVAFGLCMYCYGISIYTMPIFLIAACIYLLVTKKIKFWHAGVCVLIYLLVSWPFILTMLINFFKWDTIYTPWFTIPYFSESVRSMDILFFSDNIIEQFFYNIIASGSVFFQANNTLSWHVVPGFGTMFVFSVPFIVLGAVELFKNRKKNTGSVLCLLFFLTGLCAGLFTNFTNTYRINIIYYPMIIMAGIGIYSFIVNFKKIRWSVPVAYLMAATVFFSTYFTTYTKSIDHYFYKGFSDALVASKDIEADTYYITNYSMADKTNFQFDRSEIMTMYYHDVDSQEYYGIGGFAGFVPGKNKYVYGSFENTVIPSSENVVYIAHEDELQYFSKDDFTFEQYDNFYLISARL